MSSDFINNIEVRNDSAYVATKQGLSVIPQNYYPNSRVNPPHLIKILAEGNLIQNREKIILNKDQSNLSLVVASVDFFGNRSNIQYSLDDSGYWNDIDDNVLNLQINKRVQDIYLRTYNQNTNTYSKSLKVSVEKSLYFYQYNEFWLALGGLLIGSLFFIRNRMQKQHFVDELKKQKAIKKERERISHDMHDDIGAGISALKLQAEFLKHKVGDMALKNDIDDLLYTSEEMNTSMRELLWSLDAENDNTVNFAEYVDLYGDKFFLKSKIKYHSNIKNLNHKIELAPDKRRNLYLCIKEAFNNCYKHSKAQNVYLSISENKHLLKVVIYDDGIGIDSNHCEGNGMRNMAFRMQEINGNFHVSKTNSGTELQFTVSL